MALRALSAMVCVVAVHSSLGSTETSPASKPVFHEYEGCSAKCSDSYSPHTNPDVIGLKACQRGCRLSLIAGVSGEPNASSLCHRGCGNAYSKDVSHRYACEVGCSNNVWDNTYKEMVERELHSYMMMAQFVHLMQERFLNSLYMMQQAQSMSVFVAADGPSGVVVIAREMDYEPPQLESQQLAQPTESQPQPHRHHSIWCHMRHYHWVHWAFMLIGFGILAFFLSALLDVFSCGTPRKCDSAGKLPEKKSLLISNVPTIRRTVPVVPPGKLVEVVITEV